MCTPSLRFRDVSGDCGNLFCNQELSSPVIRRPFANNDVICIPVDGIGENVQSLATIGRRQDIGAPVKIHRRLSHSATAPPTDQISASVAERCLVTESPPFEGGTNASAFMVLVC